ncbi:Hgh1 protein [Starmerella bacillaris]|uniref:Protein HGH1 homolog n=1 Tax=Starmerella bacillaris TaxID=1247836 RepID=A0AAV5RPE5_STABA|nr:Hgh1 protein [Starmerella bacillaris]
MCVSDLIELLGAPRADVVAIAVKNLMQFSSSEESLHFFKANNWNGLRALENISLTNNNTDVVQDALICLVNLTCFEDVRKQVVVDSAAVRAYATLLTATKKASFTQYLCMLFNNLAKEPETLKALDETLIKALFLTATTHISAKDSDYDFLFMVFTEFARQDADLIAKFVPNLFGALVNGTESQKRICAATIKNCLLHEKSNENFANDTPLIETIMITLKGSEELDEEDTSKLPEVVRNTISPEKTREEDLEVQLTLLQCLLLIGSTVCGREALRRKNAYFVVRELHLATKNNEVAQLCEEYVNLVMRGEPEAMKSLNEQKQIAAAPVDEGVEEIL